MREINKLTPAEVKARTQSGNLSDGGGLLLQVTKTGGKSWTYRYQLNKVRRDKGIGPYPTFSLAQARERRDELARLVKRGIDPIEHHRDALVQAAAATAKRVTFATACEAFMAVRSKTLKTEKQVKSWDRTFALAGKVLKGFYVHEVSRQHIVACLEPDWIEKNPTAVENMLRLHALFKWSIVRFELGGANPASIPELEQLLPKVTKNTDENEGDADDGRASLPWLDLPACMTKVRADRTMEAQAMEFIILTGARLEEALQLTWQELDLTAKKWTVHKSRMKAGKTQTVPLAAQAVDLLKALPSYNSGEPNPEGLVFTAQRGGKVYGAALLKLLRRIGYTVEQVTTHGMRKSLRTYLGEVLKVREEVAEAVIAHDTRSRIRKTYERTRFYDERIDLMTKWANYTDERIAKVAKLPKHAA
ncbi:integrase arm-type DNA-binding domain-containing protein [Caballeronia sp. LZ035]|uniref:tyrosine-type recombinase/integrase n=1 Tax=Caballeronia sp. LZ035 TaxID=3038568 RepID=UPI002858B5B8|nr:integrase arm-type DNA-binding domain-containing protein [Caballeronia sp. LZ035]MDR5757859.1 integrase arm-type DNA-binding domain-containing protein [Caballeronia sp. LZ035]